MIYFPENPDDYVLCYADRGGSRLWFTTQSLHEQTGDDWDDAWYESNAGTPYGPTVIYHSNGNETRAGEGWDEDGAPKWRLFRMFVDDATLYYGNRDKSVDGINCGNSPWVEIYGDTSSYYMNPGDTLADVLERLKAIRTAYYIVGDMHPDQRDQWEIGH